MGLKLLAMKLCSPVHSPSFSKPFSLVGIKGLIEKIQDNFNAVTV